MSKLLESEAGLMMVAEMLDILGRKGFLKILLKVIYGAPIHKKEVIPGNDQHTTRLVEFLIDEGIIVCEWGRRDGEKRRRKYLFPADDGILCTVREVVSLLQRRHESLAIALGRFERDMDRR